MKFIRKIKKYFLVLYEKFTEKLFSYNTKLEILNYDLSPIKSSKNLTLNLQKIASLALKEAKAKGVEIALFDKENGRYFKSIAVGKLFKDPIDHTVKDTFNQKEENTLMELVHFAGVTIGVVRIAFYKKPDTFAHNYIKLLNQQVVVSIVNHNFIEEIQNARKSSQESLRIKTGFLASLSHELRGPLGIMLNANEIIKDELVGSINEQQKNLLSMSIKNGEHLLDLLNDVLDYARIESGKMTPQIVELEVPEVLEEIINVVKVLANNKKQKLTLECDIKARLYCDRRHFRQIMINLLTNAIKYTPDEGKILVRVESLLLEKIKISVIDNGCGIDIEDFDKVFSPFERIEKGYSASQSGNGLGLSLTQKLVQINGGFIDFDSKSNQGSNFSVIFKSSLEENTNIKEELFNVNSNMLTENPHIIFIADRSSESGMIIDYLRSKNIFLYDYQAILSTELEKIDLILIDDSYSKVYPQDLIKSIRLKFQTIPIVMLSNKAFNFNVEEYVKAGIDRYITKPILLQNLYQLLVDLVYLNSGSKAEKITALH